MSTYISKSILLKKLMRFFLFVLFIVSPITGYADEEGLYFYVQPEFPESQLEGNTSYFDLRLDPGQTETLVLQLSNIDSEAVTIQITTHTAYTNVHGVVEYGKDTEQPDNTLPYSLDELIETPEAITLEANENRTVELPLTMPEEAFEGMLAGGLRISEVKEENASEESSGEGVAITNEFSYVVGVLVSNNRSSIAPELDLLDVFANQLNYRNVISATLQNSSSTFINRLEVEATVQREGETDILYEAQKEQMQMAPNSHFDFPISLEGARFQSGNYILNMIARSGEEEWEWTHSFTIEAEEARTWNRRDVTIDTSTNWWMVVSIGLVVAFLAFIIYKEVRKRDETTDKLE